MIDITGSDSFVLNVETKGNRIGEEKVPCGGEG